MTSQLLALYGSVLLAAVCVIGVYVICASDRIGLRHVTVTPLEPQAHSRTDDIQCSTSGIHILLLIFYTHPRCREADFHHLQYHTLARY